MLSRGHVCCCVLKVCYIWIYTFTLECRLSRIHITTWVVVVDGLKTVSLIVRLVGFRELLWRRNYHDVVFTRHHVASRLQTKCDVWCRLFFCVVLASVLRRKVASSKRNAFWDEIQRNEISVQFRTTCFMLFWNCSRQLNNHFHQGKGFYSSCW